MAAIFRRISARHYRLLFGLWVTLASANAHAAPVSTGDPLVAKILASPLPDVANCSDPLVIWSEKLTVPRVNVGHFLRIDLTEKRIEVFVALSEDPDSLQGPAEGVLTQPDELLRNSGALALVNANAFAGIPSIKDALGKSGWYLGRAVDIEGLAVSDSVRRSPDAPERLAFWLDDHRKPHLGHPGANEGVRQAVADWGAPLIVNGRILAVAESPPQAPGTAARASIFSGLAAGPLHPRSMLGFDATGHWLLLVVVDGRQPGYSLGITMAEGAELMRKHGCSEAINLDGGGSSLLVARNAAGKSVTINRPSGGSQRPLPIMLGVRPTPQNAH